MVNHSKKAGSRIGDFSLERAWEIMDLLCFRTLDQDGNRTDPDMGDEPIAAALATEIQRFAIDLYIHHEEEFEEALNYWG